MLDELVMARDSAKGHEAPAPARAQAASSPVVGRRPGTRFTPPDVPAFAVARDRLVSLFDPGVQRRVAIVVAPPGYGKTVLLSQWAAAHPRRRVRWLTLESEDNDPGRFTRDWSEALGSSIGSAGETASSPLDTGDQETVAAIFAGLTPGLERAPPTTVLLDDFHLLSNPAMLDGLERTSMFITRLDGRSGWFRYHRLFRALLRHHLRDEDPTREPLLLRRAAEWHLARDD